MDSAQNSKVIKEVEKLLAPLRVKDPAQYNIVQSIIDSVYNDPTINSPEAISKEIENKIYKMIDEHVRFQSSK